MGTDSLLMLFDAFCIFLLELLDGIEVFSSHVQPLELAGCLGMPRSHSSTLSDRSAGAAVTALPEAPSAGPPCHAGESR